jgi:hypothetical protein
MKDDELAKHYEDPANRRLAGRPKRRPMKTAAPQTLSNHVPIRFSAGTMSAVQTLAHGDGMTVSAWIRSIVDRELARRLPPQTMSTIAGGAEMKEFLPSNQPPTSATRGELLRAS